MDEPNGRRETHDFMNVNVESFSQLPFIRPAPAKEKSAIRLFGKDFGAGEIQEDHDSSDNNKNKSKNSFKNDENHDKDNSSSSNNNNNSSSSSSSRKFECHYCFRNFPTSQALGGHQNAHKRERQHAKRGATFLHHHQPDATHYYGFHHSSYSYNHHRNYLGGGVSPAARFYGGQPSSFYTRGGSTPASPTTTTINGSPLGLWRVPQASNAVHGVYTATAAFGAPGASSNHSTLPLLAADHEENAAAPPSQNRTSYWYGLKGNVQDHVSLDLHL